MKPWTGKLRRGGPGGFAGNAEKSSGGSLQARLSSSRPDASRQFIVPDIASPDVDTVAL